MKHRLFSGPSLILLILFFSMPLFVSVRTARAQAEQDLDLKLVGTAVGDDPRRNFAIIEIQSTGNQGALRMGDRVGEVQIKEIMPGYVILNTGRGNVRLSLGSGERRSDESSKQDMTRLDRNEVYSKIPDYQHLMQEIRVRSRFEGGQPIGFVIYNIKPGSIFARMGLENGDIIEAVNGRPFASTQPVMDFYSALMAVGTVSLEVRRGDSRQELYFEIS